MAQRHVLTPEVLKRTEYKQVVCAYCLINAHRDSASVTSGSPLILAEKGTPDWLACTLGLVRGNDCKGDGRC